MRNELGIKIIAFTSTSPLFKGAAVTVAGLLALCFAWWMKARWREPLKGGFLVYLCLSVFITLYGLFILVFQPQWWKLPY